MPAKNNGDTPTKPNLNLDALEREGDEQYVPFVFTLGGDRFECLDVNDEDWQVLADIDETDPKASLRLILGDEQYEKFSAHRLPMWKMNRLMTSWREHNGMPAPGEATASS